MNLERNSILFGDVPASLLSIDYKYIDTKRKKITILYYQKKKKNQTWTFVLPLQTQNAKFEIISWNQFY